MPNWSEGYTLARIRDRIKAELGLPPRPPRAKRRRWTTDRLPSCQKCKRKDLTCQVSGTCHILVGGRYKEEVIEAKRQQVLSR